MIGIALMIISGAFLLLEFAKYWLSVLWLHLEAIDTVKEEIGVYRIFDRGWGILAEFNMSAVLPALVFLLGFTIAN